MVVGHITTIVILCRYYMQLSHQEISNSVLMTRIIHHGYSSLEQLLYSLNDVNYGFSGIQIEPLEVVE